MLRPLITLCPLVDKMIEEIRHQGSLAECPFEVCGKAIILSTPALAIFTMLKHTMGQSAALSFLMRLRKDPGNDFLLQEALFQTKAFRWDIERSHMIAMIQANGEFPPEARVEGVIDFLHKLQAGHGLLQHA